MRAVSRSSDVEEDVRSGRTKGASEPRLVNDQARKLRNHRISPSRSWSTVSKAQWNSDQAIPADKEAAPREQGRNNSRPSTNNLLKSSRPISSFFSTSSETAESSKSINGRSNKKSMQALAGSFVTVQGEDAIEDDLSGGEPHRKPTSTASKTGAKIAVAKPAAQAQNHSGSGQRFKLSQTSSRSQPPRTSYQILGTDGRPWSERHSPLSIDDLAVHKGKIKVVKDWLEGAFSGKSSQRLLVLKGPSGSGKSAVLNALARQMNINVVEWKNSIGSEIASEAYTPLSAQFEDFLDRGRRFSELDLVGGNRSSSIKDKNGESRPSLLTIQDFPDTVPTAFSLLHSFRSSIMGYLASHFPIKEAVPSAISNTPEHVNPLVLIITETSLSASNTDSGSLTARKVLGEEILDHRLVSVIEFNPVATSFITRALNRILQRETQRTGRRQRPHADLLKRLGEKGDIRSAINALEFAISEADGAISHTSKDHQPNQQQDTGSIGEGLQDISQRESRLGLFHAVGKVVYNKRDEVASVASDQNVLESSQHRAQADKKGESQVSIDRVMEDTGTDPATFIAALHENLVRSCNSLSPSESLEGCLSAVSDSDILTPRHSRSSALRTFGNELIKQDEMSLHVAVRGILLALPYPVKRSSLDGKSTGQNPSKSDAYKMFYPVSLRLSRQIEEIEALIRRWRNLLWTAAGSEDDQTGRRHVVPSIQMLLFDQLPYTQLIHPSGSGPLFDHLARITQFHDFSNLDLGVAEANDLETTKTNQASRTYETFRTLSIAPREKLTSSQQDSNKRKKAAKYVEIKLWLSDDDIEDD